jgi:hypothetical protein
MATDLAHWKAEQARVWGPARWQSIAESVLSAVHDELVSRLVPHPGDVRLDVPSVDDFERHRRGGMVSVPRPYLLILGHMRGGGRR